MYKILVRPILEHASQVLSYRHHYFTAPCRPIRIFKPLDFLLKLEQFHNRVLKLIIPCPKATPCGLLRLLTSTLSVAAHIDILKLRYFWKLTHSVKNNFALDIYKYRRSYFLESNIGYVHEIFNICCEYDMMWVWHGTISPKLNPLSEIKRHVVQYHLKKDLETSSRSNCVYAITCLTAKKYGKQYKVDKLLRQIGSFESTEHRRFFLYSFLDTGAYPRPVFFFLPEKKKIPPEKIFNFLPEKIWNCPRKNIENCPRRKICPREKTAKFYPRKKILCPRKKIEISPVKNIKIP